MKKILILFVFAFFSLAASTGAQETFFQYGLLHDILEVKFSPDRARLVSYSYDDGVFLWDVTNGRLLWHRKTGFVQKANEYYALTSFAFSPDRKLLASGSGNGTLQLWDAETGKILWRADVHSENVTAIEFTPDGKNIVSAASPKTADAEIRVVRVADGQTISKLDGNPCTVVALAFENEGQVLRAGNLDGNVAAWNLETRRLIETETAAPCRLNRTYEWETSFSPDLTLSAMRTGEKELTVKNTRTGEIVKKIEAEGYRVYSKFTGDGKNLIFSGYGGFTFYNPATGEARKIDRFSRTGSTFDLSLDGSLFADGGSWGGAAIKITETATGKSFFLDGHPGVVKKIVFSPNGEVFAVSGTDTNIYVFDAQSRSLLKTLAGHQKAVERLSFSADGKFLISAAAHDDLKIWDWQDGKVVKNKKSDDRLRFAFASIPLDSNVGQMLTQFDSTSFEIRDTRTWAVLKEFKIREKFTEKSENSEYSYDSIPGWVLKISKNGKTVFANHFDGKIRVWDIDQQKPVREVKYHDRACQVRILPDEKSFLAYCGSDKKGRIRHIDLTTGKVFRVYADEVGEDESGYFNTQFIEAIEIAPDGKTFITSEVGNNIWLWEIGKSKPLREFKMSFSGDDAIAFSPDGKTFVIGGKNRNLVLFDTETGEKLWQLIPSYQPDALETEFLEQRKQAQAQVSMRKSAREKQAAAEVPLLAQKITAKFSHYGTAESFQDQKIAESGEPDKSGLKLPREKASVAWFTLTNDAELPVSIDTNGMIFNPKCEGLCDGAEISSRYVIELKNGATRVNGFDMYSGTILPPKRSVYFSVALAHFAESRAIYLTFTFQKDNPDDQDSADYGARQKLYLPREAELPK